MLKNRMKQAIALLLTFVLALGGIALDPIPAAAAGNTVTIGSDSVYAIYSYKGNSKTIDLDELVVRDKSNK